MPDVFQTTWQEVVGNRNEIYNFAGASSGHHFTFWKVIKKNRIKILELCAVCSDANSLCEFSGSQSGDCAVRYLLLPYLRFSTFSRLPLRAFPSFLLNGYRISLSAVRRSERELYHLPPSSAEVKNEWSSTATPPTSFHGVERDFTFFPVVWYVTLPPP